MELDDLVEKMLIKLGEDPKRQGLLKTPGRVKRSLEYLTEGYKLSVEGVINGAIFEEKGDEMIVVQDIEFYSMCEHHMLPFYGHATVAYIPDGQILGLSKVARIVEVFARRLQVQERLTMQIAHSLNEALSPLGVGVVMEAQHFCMMMRGIRKQNSYTSTSCMVGVFKEDAKTRAEFMNFVTRRR